VSAVDRKILEAVLGLLKQVCPEITDALLVDFIEAVNAGCAGSTQVAPDLMTKTEAMALLRCGRRCFDRLRKVGVIKGYQLGGLVNSQIMYNQNELIEYIHKSREA